MSRDYFAMHHFVFVPWVSRRGRQGLRSFFVCSPQSPSQFPGQRSCSANISWKKNDLHVLILCVFCFVLEGGNVKNERGSWERTEEKNQTASQPFRARHPTDWQTRSRRLHGERGLLNCVAEGGTARPSLFPNWRFTVGFMMAFLFLRLRSWPIPLGQFYLGVSRSPRGLPGNEKSIPRH